MKWDGKFNKWDSERRERFWEVHNLNLLTVKQTDMDKANRKKLLLPWHCDVNKRARRIAGAVMMVDFLLIIWDVSTTSTTIQWRITDNPISQGNMELKDLMFKKKLGSGFFSCVLPCSQQCSSIHTFSSPLFLFGRRFFFASSSSPVPIERKSSSAIDELFLYY